MIRTLEILLWFSLMPFYCHAQGDIADREYSLVFGGDFLLNSKYRLQEDQGYRKLNITLKGNIGYFVSNYDLLLLRPCVLGEFVSYKTSDNSGSDIDFGGEIVYRRFLGNPFFGGVFIGGEIERRYANHYVTHEPQFNKEVYAGLELGYIYFLNPHVGVEASVYYSIRKRYITTDVFSDNYFYPRVGINIGLLFFLTKDKYQ